MPEIWVCARISDEHLREYEAEARRQGVTVRELVQQTVNCLLAELEAEERDCQEVSTS